MPSGYAHLRFGTQALPSLPKEVRTLARNFPQLFEVGLQGPDLMFYYDPIFKSEIGAFALQFHRQPGQAFFTNALAQLRQSPSDGAAAYLYGVLGHYCLDSLCHPYVRAVAEEGKRGHTEMETEFDRFLMERDGIASPATYDLRPHFRLTRGECETAALFYEPVTPAALRRSVRNSLFVLRLTAMKNRKLAAFLLGFGGTTGKEMVMHQSPNENCIGTSAALLSLYEQAMERYPLLAEQLSRAIADGSPLGSDFAPSFG